ncbi:hypothetical protein AMJ57_01205 [Parcubacteria bacterium SG8_24]|nr:MAG: hypothetical protein AMJ57_01205 [Parcubacteria bacterium SG8_24]
MTPRPKDPLPFYRGIIGDAWRIAWNHKHLWLFGFFASFIGFGWISEVFLGVVKKSRELIVMSYGGSVQLIPGLATLKAIIRFSPFPILTSFVFVAVGLLFVGLLLWISTVSVGGLIASIRKIVRGGELSFGEAVRSGADSFWRLFGINISAKVIAILAVIVTGTNLSLLIADGTVMSALYYLASFIIFTLLAVVASLIAVYASNYAVIKDKGCYESVVASWHLFKKHWLVSIEMAILLFLINLGVGLLALLLLFLLSVPVVFLFFVSAALSSMATLGAIFFVLAVALMIIIMILTVSFLTTFQVAAWLLVWSRVSEKGVVARLMHWWGALQPKG